MRALECTWVYVCVHAEVFVRGMTARVRARA